MNASSDWPRNRLLLALPSRNLKRLMPELEQIRCQRAQVLMNADSSLDHVFFPDSGVVSIGREGCSGVQAILGAKRSSVQLLVQIPGSAGGVKAPTIREESGAVDAEAICVAITRANMRFSGIEHGT
jgi:hypothetical protein